MYTKNAEFKAGIVVQVGLAGLLALVWFAGGSESLWGGNRGMWTTPGLTPRRFSSGAGLNRRQISRPAWRNSRSGTSAPTHRCKGTRDDEHRLY